MMKKAVVLIGIILLVFSCKKNYTCTCEKTSIGLNDIGELYTNKETINKPLEIKMSKKDAELSCKSSDYFIEGGGGTSEKLECNLE